MSLQIIFNGQTYNSLEDMPPEGRQAYEQAVSLLADQNANGLPDFIDTMLRGQSPDEILKPLSVFSTLQIVFNGQTYTSLHAMPPDARRAFEQAMSGALDQNRSGVPDLVEQGAIQPAQPFVTVTHLTPNKAQPVSTPYTPAGLEPEGPAALARQRRFLLFAVLGVALFLLALALVALIVLPSILGPR